MFEQMLKPVKHIWQATKIFSEDIDQVYRTWSTNLINGVGSSQSQNLIISPLFWGQSEGLMIVYTCSFSHMLSGNSTLIFSPWIAP